MLLLGLILGYGGAAAARETEEGFDSDLRRSAQKSLMLGRWGFLAKSTATVDTVWGLRKAMEAQPDERLAPWVDERAAELTEDKFARLIHPDAPRPMLPEDPGSGIHQLSNYVMAAVGSPESRAVKFIDTYTAAQQRGYALTHQVLVVQWAAETGLDLPSEVKERMPELLERVAAEQASQRRFNDLYAERAAILLLWDEPEEEEVARWTRTIIDEQGEDGLWGSSHTDGFCVLALSLVLDRY